MIIIFKAADFRITNHTMCPKKTPIPVNTPSNLTITSKETIQVKMVTSVFWVKTPFLIVFTRTPPNFREIENDDVYIYPLPTVHFFCIFLVKQQGAQSFSEENMSVFLGLW